MKIENFWPFYLVFSLSTFSIFEITYSIFEFQDGIINSPLCNWTPSSHFLYW